MRPNEPVISKELLERVEAIYDAVKWAYICTPVPPYKSSYWSTLRYYVARYI